MNIRVGLFFGGKSVEHEVSVITGLQAAQNIDRSRFDVIPIYITKQGEFYTGDEVGRIESYRDIPTLLRRSTRITLVNDNGRVWMVRYPAKRFGSSIVGELDVALPAVHGTNGEDGTLQGFFNLIGLPYAGCDILSSAVGMDKFVQKCVLKECGIPVLDALRLRSGDREAAEKIEARFKYPVIVKPINLGSSVGISVAHDRAGLEDALELAETFSDSLLVEPAIEELVEINCAVLGDANGAVASECERPLGSDEILSYEDKYVGGGKKTSGASKGMATLGRELPAKIPDAMRDEIRSLALRAFEALGCSGVARIDFLLDGKEKKIYLNEFNTIPGSLAFYLFEAAGMRYRDMLTRLIGMALGRARREQNITYSFDSNILSSASLGGAKGSKGAKR